MSVKKTIDRPNLDEHCQYLTSQICQQMSNEIDEEILGEILDFRIIPMNFDRNPKKGQLVRYRREHFGSRNPDGSQISESKNGLCVERYDPVKNVYGQILREDGCLIGFRPAENMQRIRHDWLEIIDEQ